MRLCPLPLLLAACAHQSPPPPAFCSAARHRSSEAQLGVHGALRGLNDVFLDVDAQARAQRCAWLEHDGLVLRYATGTLEARWHGRVLLPATNVLPREYHPLKDVSHALLLAGLIAIDPDTERKQRQTKRALQAIDALMAELTQPGSVALSLIAPEHLQRQKLILQQSRSALLATTPELARVELARAHEALEQNLTLVATATLEGLHAAVQGVHSQIDQTNSTGWNTMLVVIAVAHQARAQALELQYFERLLGEKAQEGARGERHIVVVENLDAAPDQYGALATHLVDQSAGAYLFADREHLQHDVLSGHTAVLDRLLPPVPESVPAH